MTERLLLATGSAIMLGLGSIHLYYTFYTTKLWPRDASVVTSMQATSPQLTSQTTIWKTWLGFNASHSTGAMFFGTIYMAFSISYFDLFRQSILLQVLLLVNSFYYLFLAKRYWFSVPFKGILISTVFFLTAIIIIHTAS